MINDQPYNPLSTYGTGSSLDYQLSNAAFVKEFKSNRLRGRDGVAARTALCCASIAMESPSFLPSCIGAAHYFACCGVEYYTQYGIDKDYTIEVCCSTCRCKKTAGMCQPCFKCQNTCMSVDCKVSLPVDEDQPLEIAACGIPIYLLPFKKMEDEIKIVRLTIRSIKVTDAKAVEIIGNNDLFCEIDCGTIKYRTPTLDNCGASGDWDLGHAGDNASGLFKIEEIKKLKLKLSLWDENVARSNTKIGVSDPIDMSKLTEAINDTRSFSFTVSNPQGKPTGKVVIRAVLTKHYTSANRHMGY